MKDLLPSLAIDLSAGRLDPQALFAFKPQSFHVEIGFGDGERLIAQALANPTIGFIGCEPFVNGVAKALAAIDDLHLKNIRLHCGDARDFLRALPNGAINQLELLYPDPWPKRRQHKRRIVTDEFIGELARVLKKGAHWRFATDIDDYAGWTLTRVFRSEAFLWRAKRSSDWLTPWEGWFSTRYELKAREAGRSSAYCTFERI